jgi:hypothetical protein
MAPPKEAPVVSSAIGQFKHAAIVADFGYRDEDEAMQIAGQQSAARAVRALESLSTDGRMALIPLLEDADLAIRVLAAGYLVKVIPEQALTVLKQINEARSEEASITAFRLLMLHDLGELKL